jgi:hypothetical protein
MLIVEDGTGVEDANSYIDTSFAENYLLGERLTQFSVLSNEEKEAAIISGTQLVDNLYTWEGRRKSLEQGLNWPRSGVEIDGFTIEGIPAAIKKAVCEAVFLFISGESFYSTENDRVVTSEKVDTLQITYGNTKESGKTVHSRFEVLDMLCRDLIKTTTMGGSSVGSAAVLRV